MKKAMDTVGAFYDAFGHKDWGRLRALLADNFTFRGSLASFNSPDEFIEGVSQMPMEGAPADSAFIVDGNRVAHTFVWKMTAPTRIDVPMCEVLDVENGKVLSSELFYDSRHFPMPS